MTHYDITMTNAIAICTYIVTWQWVHHNAQWCCYQPLLLGIRQTPIPHVIPLTIYCVCFSPTPTPPPPLWHVAVFEWFILFLAQPSIVCVCVCMCVYVCVCVCLWSLVLHMAGTWYNSLDSHLSLSFNSKDNGIYCAQLFTCFTEVHIKLYWTLLKRFICHWAPMLKSKRFPRNGNLIL